MKPCAEVANVWQALATSDPSMLVFWNVVAPDGPKSENLPSCVEELTNFPLSKNFETFFF